MSRYITELDIEAPNIPLLKTLEMDFTYQAGQPYGGLNTEMFPLDAVPWLWRAYMQAGATSDPSVGTHVFELQGEHNGTKTVVVKPSESYTQLIINREAQYYVRRFEQGIAGNQIPELVYLDTDNSLAFRSMRTPAAFEDKALGNLDAYEVVSFNATTREIRFKGIVYDRKQASDGGKYGIGKYKGAAKFMRDILDNDQEQLDLSWKFKTHAYGHAKLIGSNKRVTYDRLTDDNARDPVGGTTGDTYHTMRLRESLTTAERPIAGDYVQMFRRQTHVAGSLTTSHTWSQKYWMIETEIELARSFYQFFAIFGWNMYQETTDGISWNASDLTKRLKDGEIDLFENPCGDVRWRYHNAHAPKGGQYNMAALQGRTPVMPARTPEWDRETMQEHQLDANVGSPYTERTTLRQYWYPPGNAANKPGNSLEWYMRVPDGRFMRIGGCLAPDFWVNGTLDDKQIFFTSAVGGDFLRGLNYEYGGGLSNSPKVEDFISKVYSFSAYQFPGQMAGGAGAPGPDGKWPTGKQPTPGDLSGNSGSGIVGDDGGTGDGGPVTPFSTSVDIITTAGKIAVPQVGKSYPIASRAIRNTEGFGMGFNYTPRAVDGFEVSVEKLTDDGTQAEFTFTSVGSPPPGGLVLDNLITVDAVETSGPGTAPIINGPDAIVDEDVVVPTDPDPDPDPFNGSILIGIRGPNVAGQVTGIPLGTMLSIQVSTNQFFYAKVLTGGFFQFVNFGTDFHGKAMTVNYPGPPVFRSKSFFYDNPVVVSGVWVLRFEVQSVGDGTVTLYLGLSKNRPAEIRYGTNFGDLNQSQVVSATSDFGDDSSSPHIYALTGLSGGQLYFFQMFDQVSGSYTTSIINGTPSGAALPFEIDKSGMTALVLPVSDVAEGGFSAAEWANLVSPLSTLFWETNGDAVTSVVDTSGRRAMCVRLDDTQAPSTRVGAGAALAPSQSARVSQWVYFDPGFDWGGTNEGGKLGWGLAGGSRKATGTGGPTDTATQSGFSSRFMWRTGGSAYVLVYDANTVGTGTDISLGFNFPRGAWFELAMGVVANTAKGAQNGELLVWYNGALLTNQSTRTWYGTNSINPVQVDSLIHYTFHEGTPNRVNSVCFGDAYWDAGPASVFGLSVLQPAPGYVATSPDVFFEWTDSGNPNAVYDLHVYSDAGRTQKVVGDNGVFDTSGLGTTTSHTFTGDPSNGAMRYGTLYQWSDNTYDPQSLQTILFTYTAYENVVNPGSYSTPTFIVPQGEIGQYATVSWTDPTPDPNARLNLYIDGQDDGNSVPADQSTSWTVQRALSAGVHTFDLRRYMNGDFSTFDVPTSMTPTVEQVTVGVGDRYEGPAYGATALVNYPVATSASNRGSDLVSIQFKSKMTRLDAARLYHVVRLPPSDGGGYSKGDGGTIKYQLRTDNGGEPSGTVLAETPIYIGCPGLHASQSAAASAYPGAIWSSYGESGTRLRSFRKFNFPTQPTLTVGQQYHIVMVNTCNDPTNKYISLDGVYAGPAGDYGVNNKRPGNPCNGARDGGIALETFGSWRVLEMLACYELYGDKVQGFTWLEMSADGSTDRTPNVTGSSRLRTVWRPRSNTSIKRVGIMAGRRSGTGNLTLQIKQNGITLYTTSLSGFPTIASSNTTVDQVSEKCRFVEVAIPSSFTLSSSYDVYFEISTDGSTHYEVPCFEDGAKNGLFDGSVNSGSSNTHVQISTNSGSSWAGVTHNSSPSSHLDMGFFVQLNGGGCL